MHGTAVVLIRSCTRALGGRLLIQLFLLIEIFQIKALNLWILQKALIMVANIIFDTDILIAYATCAEKYE